MRGEKTKQLWSDPAYRERMSKSHKGTKMPAFTQEHKDRIRKTLTGKKHTPERIAKASSVRKGLPMLRWRGEGNPAWKGGVTPLKLAVKNLLQFRVWRSDVYTRDDFTCQVCSVRGGKLEADHVKPFSWILEDNNIQTVEEAISCDELWNINNGRTLCRSCHQKTPTYGMKAKHRKI